MEEDNFPLAFVTIVAIIAIVSLIIFVFPSQTIENDAVLVDEQGNIVGQFAVREGGRTVGAGVVIEIIE